MMKDVLKKMNLGLDCVVTPFLSEEDNSEYQVYKVQCESKTMVLKKTTLHEIQMYQTYLKGFNCVPELYQVTQHGQDWYILMEYIEGVSLSRCTRAGLTLALDSLILLQQAYWNVPSLDKEAVRQRRQKRLGCMGDLQSVYQMYLDEFNRIPVTLTHDDLLPINVLYDGQKAVLLDWNEAGLLPYATALARLIAYGQQEDHALFQMSEEDKQFALTYYYEKLIAEKGIDYQEYLRTMDLFLFKEYSEWVYCAHLANDFEMEYYRIYEPKAREIARKLGRV